MSGRQSFAFFRTDSNGVLDTSLVPRRGLRKVLKAKEMPTPQDVLEEALNLDAHDRVALAQEPLASLEELTEQEAERLWAEEAKKAEWLSCRTRLSE